MPMDFKELWTATDVREGGGTRKIRMLAAFQGAAPQGLIFVETLQVGSIG